MTGVMCRCPELLLMPAMLSLRPLPNPAADKCSPSSQEAAALRREADAARQRASELQAQLEELQVGTFVLLTLAACPAWPACLHQHRG